LRRNTNSPLHPKRRTKTSMKSFFALALLALGSQASSTRSWGGGQVLSIDNTKNYKVSTKGLDGSIQTTSYSAQKKDFAVGRAGGCWSDQHRRCCRDWDQVLQRLKQHQALGA
jgi:hypothetical protein